MKLEKAIGWDEGSIESLLEYYIGGDWGKEPEHQDEGMDLAYCIRGSEIKNWTEDKGKTASLRKIKKNNIIKRQLIEGDILVEISGGGPEQPVGRTILIDKAALSFEPEIPKICTNFLRLIRPLKTINSKYLNLYLQLFYSSGEIVNFQNGSNNLRNLKFPEFLKITIPFPLIKEQQLIVEKIEELFSELDKGIENLKTAQQQLKVYRQAVLKWTFDGQLSMSAKDLDSTLPNKDILKAIKTQKEEACRTNKIKIKPLPVISDEELLDLSELPESMHWVRLGEILWSVKDGPHYSPKYAESGIPFISGGNIRPSGIDFSKCKYISKELHSELSKRCKPVLGDVLYTKGGTTGIAKVNTYDFEFNVWVHVAVLKPIPLINPLYLQHALNSQHCYRQAQKYTHGVGNQDLGLTRMVLITLPICDIDKQNEIVELIESRISVCDKIEENITTSLLQAEALRQSILKKAFEGKLVKLQPVEAKVVSINAQLDDWQRKVLAGKIIFACYDDRSFGTTKFQKALYLCENFAELDFDSHYIKQTAGPLDSKFIYPFINEAANNGWFVQETNSAPYHFEPLDGIGKLTKDYPKYFNANADKINFVLKKLEGKNTDDSELIATIYAIWNNYLILGSDLGDTQLVQEIYDWSDSKAKFTEKAILVMWQSMKDEGLMPNGFGKLISVKIA